MASFYDWNLNGHGVLLGLGLDSDSAQRSDCTIEQEKPSSLAFKRVVFWVSWGILLLKNRCKMIVVGIEVSRKDSTSTSYSEKKIRL
jgi:hypothetical protein